MKPCLSVIVTKESLLISQRYYPVLPPPGLHSFATPSYIVLQDQVHRGQDWRRVMGPLSLCLRAGWMCPPCRHWIGPRFLLSLSVWSPVSTNLPTFLTDPYFKVFKLHVDMQAQFTPLHSNFTCQRPLCENRNNILNCSVAVVHTINNAQRIRWWVQQYSATIFFCLKKKVKILSLLLHFISFSVLFDSLDKASAYAKL